MPQRYCHTCSAASTAPPSDTLWGILLWLLDLFYWSIHTDFEEKQMSPQTVQSRPTDARPLWAWHVPHPVICSSTPSEVTLLPHEAPDPGQYPVTQLLMAVKDQSSWGKGNQGNAWFSSPVFTAVPIQFSGSKQTPVSEVQNLTHSVFKASGFIKLQIHHESTEKVIKHHSGTQLVSHFQHKHREHWPAICKHFHCHLAESQPFQPQLHSHFTNSIQRLPDWKCSEKNNFIYS